MQTKFILPCLLSTLFFLNSLSSSAQNRKTIETTTDILISDLHIFQGKRCRMPHPGPFFSPVCRRIPDSEFNCIERFLYQFFYLYRIGIIPISEQARHPRIANKHSMRIYILTKLQKFIITESVSTPVSPQIVFTGSGHRITDRLFPLHPVVQGQSFDDTSPGQRIKSGFSSANF